MKSENNTENTAGSDCQERLVSGSFAPRPWHIGEVNPWLIYAADGYAVADVRTYHGMRPDAKADARLIAAAPEMLEALERIREYQGRFGEDDPKSIATALLARISSANVKEHATLSAGASVDHGFEVEITEDHVNRAADRGCCVSTCSPLVVL